MSCLMLYLMLHHNNWLMSPNVHLLPRQGYAQSVMVQQLNDIYSYDHAMAYSRLYYCKVAKCKEILIPQVKNYNPQHLYVFSMHFQSKVVAQAQIMIYHITDNFSCPSSTVVLYVADTLSVSYGFMGHAREGQETWLQQIQKVQNCCLKAWVINHRPIN